MRLPLAALSLLLPAVALAQGASTAAPAAGPDVEFLTPYGRPSYPFSPAVRVGELLFLSGQIGSETPSGGKLVEGGIQAETRRTLENIRDVLEKSGSSLERVVKCTVMMADMAEWPKMNEVYVTFFPGNKPARSAFGATGLALGARVEIECIATAGPKAPRKGPGRK
jgi:reactive intermediate/imine deaminase